MRKKLIPTLFAIMLSAAAHAQTGEVTDSGTYVADATGRYVRLEGHDGVIVDFLYDSPEATLTSGITVRPNDKVTLTVRFETPGGVKVNGLPAITSRFDDQGRTTAVHAAGKPVALVDYAPSGLVDAVILPSRLTWKISVPDSSGRVWQSVENASGKVMASFLVTNILGIVRRAWYGEAADLGISMDSLTYENSTTGLLTIARDAKGQVAFYVVHAENYAVGFSPDGTPRFYDLPLSVFGGTMAPGSDIVVSRAWDTQGATVPDRFVLTASGAVGLYVDAAPAKGIVAAWSERPGKVSTTMAEVEPVIANAHR
jgi:hypothetical protein